MKRITVATAILGTLIVSGSVVGEETPQRPNIILCMCDDLGWGDVGYNGHPVIKTPNLDRMAEEGVRFDRFYASSPVCSPTRASCLTGRHPSRTGVFYANGGLLRPEEVTVAEILKEQGYTTGHFGKWHLGTMTADENDSNRGRVGNFALLNPPDRHGFDYYFSTEAKVPTWDPMLKPDIAHEGKHLRVWDAIKEGDKTLPYGTAYWENGVKATENLAGCDSRVMMDRAIPFIENAARSGTPFLAVIWFHAPHYPTVAGPQYAAMYEDQNDGLRHLAGCITAVDDQMGRLRDKLRELGIDGNTMLFFNSDNGPEGFNKAASAGKFRGTKRSLYEGGVRVPGLLVWPDKVGHKVVDAPVVTSDILPTVVDALDLDVSDQVSVLDGTSIMPLLEGNEFKRPTPIGFHSRSLIAYSGETYKLFSTRNPGEDWLYEYELYDLVNDPYEKVDIADQYPEMVKEMVAEHSLWLKSLEDSFLGKDYPGGLNHSGKRLKWPQAKPEKKQENDRRRSQRRSSNK